MFGSSRRTETISNDHAEVFLKTKKRVGEAVSAVLGSAADITHELLTIGADVLQFAPVPALDLAAKALLGIWDAVELIEMNRMACLRLTERCADMLLSVREEIHLGGIQLAKDMKDPILKLEAAFTEICAFLQRQICRPFLHRYLKRDDIRRDILHCDALLSDALGMFSFRIQIRMLQFMRSSEASQTQRRPSETKGRPVSDIDSGNQKDADVVRRQLGDYRISQNLRDLAEDMADLRQLMHSALQKKDDVAIVDVFQISRDEMPEAIRDLRRALKGRAVDSRATSAASPPVLEAAGRSREAYTATQTLDRDFIQSGIDALTRLSQGRDLGMPEWTITRFEVELEEKIGIGFFSDVYKGRWRGRTVAIKILAETTPRTLFIREASVWKKLNHPNVLKLLGPSSATSNPPWFFVSPYYRNGNLAQYLRGLGSILNLNIIKLLQEIARGMSYLHHRGVIHGDLKASNILVSDIPSCVVADFGQSEMRSEVYALSGQPMSRGSLRWQSPELMDGRIAGLTREVDVYAFGISCVEILTVGALPWPYFDDGTVRHLVCDEKKRPRLPDTPVVQGPLSDIIQLAWIEDPASRPSFDEILQALDKLRPHEPVRANSGIVDKAAIQDVSSEETKLQHGGAVDAEAKVAGGVTIHDVHATRPTVELARPPRLHSPSPLTPPTDKPGSSAIQHVVEAAAKSTSGAVIVPSSRPSTPTNFEKPPLFSWDAAEGKEGGISLPDHAPTRDVTRRIHRRRVRKPVPLPPDLLPRRPTELPPVPLPNDSADTPLSSAQGAPAPPLPVLPTVDRSVSDASAAAATLTQPQDGESLDGIVKASTEKKKPAPTVPWPVSTSYRHPSPTPTPSLQLVHLSDQEAQAIERWKQLPNTDASFWRYWSIRDNGPGRVRRGFWNRRGDHLTPEGYIVRVPNDRTFPFLYPPELYNYPDGDNHFRNHLGKEAQNPLYRELPGGGANYDKYIAYYG
ncbi:kinase-like protein [Peniophora sp. CONT]|nr:kinase-like protein [Peniophora sp. CONT]